MTLRVGRAVRLAVSLGVMGFFLLNSMREFGEVSTHAREFRQGLRELAQVVKTATSLDLSFFVTESVIGRHTEEFMRLLSLAQFTAAILGIGSPLLVFLAPTTFFFREFFLVKGFPTEPLASLHPERLSFALSVLCAALTISMNALCHRKPSCTR